MIEQWGNKSSYFRNSYIDRTSVFLMLHLTNKLHTQTSTKQNQQVTSLSRYHNCFAFEEFYQCFNIKFWFSHKVGLINQINLLAEK